MPCWYYEKKDLRVTASFKDGINADVEARYRREGARFIIDSGTKMGLRYDTCATGVVYFHRFYMFHSFREFHRYVTAACCLFLAGKVEETPKKCKDIIKVTRSMLTEAQFQVFGDDPREEVMTMERILLQTIKFDLMLEHPYAYLMKFAKLIKGDKDKTQKLVQMAWTFVNDSLCTSLCLQWEPDIIALSLMYLASRLTKVDITDWVGKVPGQKGVKWYEGLIEDSTLEILEEVCHQVLDLYSTTPQASKEESPPPPPPPPKPTISPVPTKTPTKRSRSPSPSKPPKTSHQASPQVMQQQPPPQHQEPVGHPAKQPPVAMAPTGGPMVTVMGQPKTSYEQTNPFLSSNMYSSSFMSGEGSNAIQTLIGGRQQPAAQYNTSQPPPQQGRVAVTYANTAYPPPAVNYQYQQQQQAQAAQSTRPASSLAGSTNLYQPPQAVAATAASQYTTGQQQTAAAKQYSQQYSAYSQQQQAGYHYTTTPGAAGATVAGQQAGQAVTQASQVYSGGYSQSYTAAQQPGYGGASGGAGGGASQYRGGGGVGGGGSNRGRQQGMQGHGRGRGGTSLTPVRITGRQQQRR